MRTVGVGSVVKVTEKCLRRLSGTWKISSVEMRPNIRTSLPIFGNKYAFWCDISLFQIGSTIESDEALEGTTTEGSNICQELRDELFGMVFETCHCSDGYVVRPTLGIVE